VQTGFWAGISARILE